MDQPSTTILPQRTPRLREATSSHRLLQEGVDITNNEIAFMHRLWVDGKKALLCKYCESIIRGNRAWDPFVDVGKIKRAAADILSGLQGESGMPGE